MKKINLDDLLENGNEKNSSNNDTKEDSTNWCGGLSDDSRLQPTKSCADKSSVKSPRKIRRWSCGSLGDTSSRRLIMPLQQCVVRFSLEKLRHLTDKKGPVTIRQYRSDNLRSYRALRVELTEWSPSHPRSTLICLIPSRSVMGKS